MLQRIKSMVGYKVKATDGDLGKVSGFLFDEKTWFIRYMAVETGSWLMEREVLISLSALEKADWGSCTFELGLKRAQVCDSPDIDLANPLSRSHEIELNYHYQWPLYWEGFFGGIYGVSNYPQYIPEKGVAGKAEGEPQEETEDTHLRSIRQVLGCQIHGTDGKIGHLDDLIVEKDTWNIRYIVVNTGSWLPGRLVLVSPQWIKDLDWDEAKIQVDISRKGFKKSPAYDPSQPIDGDYENMLLSHLQKPAPAEWVTFRFHAAKGAKVCVAGTFNKWNKSNIRLHPMVNDLYSTTLLLPQGRYEYKFLVNGKWCDADSKEQAPNPFGTMNNVLVVTHKLGHKGHAHTFSRLHGNENQPIWGSAMGG